MKSFFLLVKSIKKHAISELLCVLMCLFFVITGCCPSGDSNTLQKTDADQNAHDHSVNSSDWKECCVSFINYAFGTEIYTIRPDGSCSVYWTEDVCSVPAFYKGKCPTVSLCESLPPSRSNSERICKIIGPLYTNNELLQIDIPLDSIKIQSDSGRMEGEPIFASVCVDEKEIVEFIVNYTGEPDYPPNEYKELISFFKELFPNSSILR